jgi:acetyl-CoA C-acetyltransferase
VPDAVIAAATRTPIGRAHKGSLTAVRPDDLAAGVVRGLLDRVPALSPDDVEDLILGCGEPAGEAGFNAARVVAILAGLERCPGVTVNRYCASSLQAARMAAHAIRAGEGDVFVAAGVECVSRYTPAQAEPDGRNEHFAPARARTLRRAAGGAPRWTPPAGLPDVYIAMGQTAENVRELESVGREEMDEFALRSHRRAVAARDAGAFDPEITPVVLADGTVVTQDDCPRPGTSLEALAALSPVFRPDGEVTAGNSCPLNDGAAAVLVMSDTRARELGIHPLARIVASGVSALDPEIMGLGPVDASEQALARAGMTIRDIGLVEINEAFAAQVIPAARRLGVEPERLNTRGGAIALGHPFGMTGARMLTTLLGALEGADEALGLATMCVGGGQGMAMIIERVG